MNAWEDRKLETMEGHCSMEGWVYLSGGGGVRKQQQQQQQQHVHHAASRNCSRRSSCQILRFKHPANRAIQNTKPVVILGIGIIHCDS